MFADKLLTVVCAVSFVLCISCDPYDSFNGWFNKSFLDYLGIEEIVKNQEWGFMTDERLRETSNIGGVRRVIVEDQISMEEHEIWDWNDAVFDVYIREDSTTITLLAAMGTKELYVAGREVHSLFNVHPSFRVDTRMGNYEPVSFRIKTISWNVNDIPVQVRLEGKTYDLLAEPGKAPNKICTGTDFDWCREGEDIKLKYPKFKIWCMLGAFGDDSWYR